MFVCHLAKMDIFHCIPAIRAIASDRFPGTPLSKLVLTVDYNGFRLTDQAGEGLPMPSIVISDTLNEAQLGTDFERGDTIGLMFSEYNEKVRLDTSNPQPVFAVVHHVEEGRAAAIPMSMDLRRDTLNHVSSRKSSIDEHNAVDNRAKYGIGRLPRYTLGRDGRVVLLESVEWDAVDEIWARGAVCEEGIWVGIKQAVDILEQERLSDARTCGSRNHLRLVE